MTCSRVEFWRSRTKESEARLQMYEGKKAADEPKCGGTDDSSENVVRHVSPARIGSEGGVQVHVTGMPDETLGFQLAHGSGKPSGVIESVVDDVQMMVLSQYGEAPPLWILM